jgi:hypothetical protein
MQQITDSQYSMLKKIFKYSFSGAMVGKPKNKFLSFDDLSIEEKRSYGYDAEETYNSIVNLFKNDGTKL